MTTYTALSAGASKTAKTVGWAGAKMVATGTVVLDVAHATAPVTTGPLTGDIYRLVKLPQGAIIVGGRFIASRFSSGSSAASVTCTLNIGLSGAFKDTIDGTSYGATTASAALGAAWTVEFEPVSLGGVKAESGMNQALGGLLYSLGPLKLTEDQWAQITFLGSASSFISGSQLTLQVDYYMGTHA